MVPVFAQNLTNLKKKNSPIINKRFWFFFLHSIHSVRKIIQKFFDTLRQLHFFFRFFRALRIASPKSSAFRQQCAKFILKVLRRLKWLADYFNQCKKLTFFVEELEELKHWFYYQLHDVEKLEPLTRKVDLCIFCTCCTRQKKMANLRYLLQLDFSIQKIKLSFSEPKSI